jgi:hypothetical protein
MNLMNSRASRRNQTAVSEAIAPQTTAPKGNRHRQPVVVTCVVSLSIDPGGRRFLLSRFAKANYHRWSPGRSFNLEFVDFADFKLPVCPKGQLPKRRRKIIKMSGPKLGRSIFKPQDFVDEWVISPQSGGKLNFSIPLAGKSSSHVGKVHPAVAAGAALRNDTVTPIPWHGLWSRPTIGN